MTEPVDRAHDKDELCYDDDDEWIELDSEGEDEDKERAGVHTGNTPRKALLPIQKVRSLVLTLEQKLTIWSHSFVELLLQCVHRLSVAFDGFKRLSTHWEARTR